MVDMEVTMAILMDRSSATPMLPKIKLNTGTMSKPPPKPSKPAMKPTTVPVMPSSKKICSSMDLSQSELLRHANAL